jgi:precorrin-3B synthase
MHAARLGDALVAAGVVLADADRDERRNVLASPTAGVDPDELLDAGPFVLQLVDRLVAHSRDVALAPKFGVALDGGGRIGLRGRRHDLAFGAVRIGADVAVEVRVGEALPSSASHDDVLVIEPTAMVDALDAVIELAAGERPGETVERLGRDHVLDALVAAIGGDSRRVAARDVGWPVTEARPELAILGIQPQRAAHAVSVGATPDLGCLDATALTALAELTLERGGNEIRLTPWRGVVITDVPSNAALPLLAGLEELGLCTDPRDPSPSVIACVGSAGCEHGATDTRRDARTVIAALRDLPPGRRPGSVHVSGCSKLCAGREPRDLTLVGIGEGRYDVFAGTTCVSSGVRALDALRAFAAAPAPRRT